MECNHIQQHVSWLTQYVSSWSGTTQDLQRWFSWVIGSSECLVLEGWECETMQSSRVGKRRGRSWLRDLLVTSSSNWFLPRCALRLSLPTSAHVSLSWGMCSWVCVWRPLAETETDGQTPIGYTCLLPIRTLCQEAWTCAPLRATADLSGCQAASSKPSVLFYWHWHTEVRVVFTSPRRWQERTHLKDDTHFHCLSNVL